MTTKKKNIELTRVNMNLPAELVKKVVKYGESKGLNTTSAYIVLLNQGLAQDEMINSLPVMMGALQTYRTEQMMKDQENQQEEDS